MVLVVTDDTNSARDVISIFMITIYVNNKPQPVNNHTLPESLQTQLKVSYFKISFWCHRLDKNTNEIFSKISALASKKRLNKKLYYTNYVKKPLISIIKCLYFFDLTSF